jgi:hypothetical protein
MTKEICPGSNRKQQDMNKEIERTIGSFAKGDLPRIAIGRFAKGDLPRTIGRFCQRRFAQEKYRTVAPSAKGDLS